MTIIESKWQELANAVIQQAIYDVKYQGNKKRSPDSEVKTAVRFLNNSRELEFYADIAGKRNDLVNAGYLKPMR